MYRKISQSMLHISTPAELTTINYTLSWPHLENPSNTTFVDSTQIDICRCRRLDLPQQTDEEAGHIYKRYQCAAPEVSFISPDKALWVLEVPHGPINMLRPATSEERERYKQIHDNAEPAAYIDRNFLLLSGPCPRGRYQAYATLCFLRSLSPVVQQQVSCLTLLLQPYEEDCSDEASIQSYGELAEFIVQHLRGFKKLHLNFWDDEMKLKSAASQFSILLHREGVKIVVGCSWWKDRVLEYDSARPFLEEMSVSERRPGRSLVDLTPIWEEAQENSETEEDESETGDDKANNDETARLDDEEQNEPEHDLLGGTPRRKASILHSSNEGDTPVPNPKGATGHIEPTSQRLLQSEEQGTQRVEVEEKNEPSDDGSDDDWTNVALSPVSPESAAEDNWQNL